MPRTANWVSDFLVLKVSDPITSLEAARVLESTSDKHLDIPRGDVGVHGCLCTGPPRFHWSLRLAALPRTNLPRMTCATHTHHARSRTQNTSSVIKLSPLGDARAQIEDTTARSPRRGQGRRCQPGSQSRPREGIQQRRYDRNSGSFLPRPSDERTNL